MAVPKGADRRGLVQALDRAELMIRRAGSPTARLDAEVMAAEAAGVTRAQIVAGACAPSCAELARLDEMVRRRVGREPVAYIVGHKEFYGLRFEVDPSVLIPRPETETLVEAALAAIRELPGSKVLDLGTGCGAIAVAIAVEAPRARVIATDISPAALRVASRNAASNRVSHRIDFLCCDEFGALRRASSWPFDLIVSNPPYVTEDMLDSLAPEVWRYEPRVALTAGSDALRFHRILAREAPRLLSPQGVVMVEVGAGQAARVEKLFSEAGMAATGVISDLAGVRRVVTARTHPSV